MGLDFDGEKLLQRAQERWDRKTTIVIVLLVTAFALLWFFAGIKLNELSPLEIGTTVVVLAGIYLFWFFSRRLPKTPKGRIGFAVAIACETKEQEKQLGSDFVMTLRRLLDRSGDKTKFTLIEIPPSHAKRIQTTEDALKYRSLCRAHFMIYGTAKVRVLGNRRQHVINMEGVVSHKPTTADNQKTFSKEFSEVFPRRLHLDVENDLMSFEFTSEWVDSVARYIIGIAAFLSGDINYAQSLFEDLQSQSKLIKTDLPAMAKIRQRLPRRLADIYHTRAFDAVEKWRAHKQSAPLIDLKANLDKLHVVDPHSYAGHLLRAIYHFVSNRNVTSSIAEVRQCRDVKDGTWRYSYAFLLAYEGEMLKARRMYKAAFDHYCAPHVPFQTEDFMVWILQLEPDKIQLHFCLGLVNWHAKGDKAQALADFEKFLQVCPPGRFTEETRLAGEYVKNIKAEMKLDSVAGGIGTN